MKNKDKLFEGLKQSSFDAKKMRGCDYEQVDKAVFKWFYLQRSQNVLIDGPILKEKVLQFAKRFNFLTFKFSQFSALDDLKDAAMFSDKGVQMKTLILSFEWLYENERLKCLKQRDITDFFTPV